MYLILSLKHYSSEQNILFCAVCCIYQINKTQAKNFGTSITEV